jgi:[protein-PII] uridylyltransferase
MNLEQKIEELLYQKADDFEVSKVIKSEIKNYLNSLDIIFESDQGKNFLVRHTKNIDSIIKSAYKYTLRTFFKEYLPLLNSIPITLVALGSYGREQLCVYSDIDLMIVYEEVEGFKTKSIIEKLMQLLWDSGMKLGHRVHEIKELKEASRSDQTIKTALIESRYIGGSKLLWVKVENSLKKIIKDEPKKFILAKLDEYRNRRKKYPFSMEPDIKNSPGGLRDFNTIYWIAKTKFNIPKIKDLPSYIISYHEYNSILSSVEFLYRVRSAMHIEFGKKQDKLIIEYAPSIAKRLNMGERKLVRKTFQAMHTIRNISQIVIKRLTKEITYKSENIPKLKASYIDSGIFLCQNKLFKSLKRKRDNFCDIFNFINRLLDKDIKYDITFINYLSNSKKEFSKINLKSFFQKRYIYHTTLALYNANILTNIISPLRKVKHLEQFDGYHKYPVDIHSILTLKAMENISQNYIKDIYNSLTKSQIGVLKFSALLHDCGKGRKQDHSILGANIAKRFALEIGYSEDEANMVHLLIKNHTRLSNTASREDIYSDKVIFNFLSHIKSKEALDMLLILTYADIESVGKGTFSNLNANLIKELYEISLEAIKNKKGVSEAVKREKKEKELRKDKEFLSLKMYEQKKILSLESNLLFFKYTPKEIVDISRWCFDLSNSYDYKITNEKNLIIEIIRIKEFNLGYFLSKLSNFSVMSMDIFKFFNKIKYFKIEFIDEVKEEMDIERIKDIIKSSFDMSKKPKLYPLDIKKEELAVDCNHSRSYASFKINTKDQKGLLANIMAIFDDIGVDIASAKIQTIKKRTRNLILVEKNGKFCKNHERIIEKLCVE